MKLAKLILTAILILSMTVACSSSTAQSAAEAPKEQETQQGQEAAEEPEEQEEPEAQEAQQEQEAAEAPEAQEAQETAEAPEAQEAQETSEAPEAQETNEAPEAQEEAGAQEDLETEEVLDAAGDMVKALFGEGGPLSGVLPEGTDIDQIVDSAREQLEEAGNQLEEAGSQQEQLQGQMEQTEQELGKVFGEIIEKAKDAGVDFNEDSLAEYAESLLGQLLGLSEFGDDFSFDALDAYIENHNRIEEAENDYIKEYNAGLMDIGEVQIISNDNLYEDEDTEQEEFRMLRLIIENNYTMDEENQLRYVSSSEDVVLFTHQKGEDGEYLVKDAVFAEKGDNYDSSVLALYEEVNEPADEWEQSFEISRIFVLYDLEKYLEDHPDVKGIEFEGEVRTAEELHELWDARFTELCDQMSENEQTEDAGADGTAETAAETAP